MKNVGLAAAASSTDAVIQKTIFESGCPSDLASPMITLIISNEWINDITKIVKSLEESALLIKRVIETTKNESKKQKWGFLLVTLGASLLWNLLTGKGTIRAGEGTIRSGCNF